MIPERPKIKVGILGGAFDPVTVGHIQLAKFVVSTGVVDQVWLTPCYKHRYDKDMVDADHRLAMCKIATATDQTIGACDIEIIHHLRGETYNLIKKIQANAITNKIYDFSVIIGQDNANTFDQWYKYEELAKMVRFIVVPRKGVETQQDWYKAFPHLFLNTKTNIIKISSTEVRQRLSFAKYPNPQLETILPEGVLKYIFRHKLYQ